MFIKTRRRRISTVSNEEESVVDGKRHCCIERRWTETTTKDLAEMVL